ncbi:putative signal transduction protein [Methylophaga frappieri]|uniref:Putative signal transduction protein n=1 Tax=Methylophaga frappieri (strain ATCC BAA-2434 / DSM 25690 / JAM7) TaxID=754477 RepID=I1YJX9_METFJ|nr:HDOD domain-containing protein [Methylophaga frappieri]AFJ03222.1 putative signal transduction protein [Methylophaga frappieri]
MSENNLPPEDPKLQFDIPPKPDILLAINQALDKPDADSADIAEVISRDVALSALVLKTVNSVMFGLPRKLSDIRQAVVMLGTKRIQVLVNYFALRHAVKGKASISLEKFWDNTMEVATMSRLVVDYLRLNRQVDVDLLYALCLFRDCGIPVMSIKFQDYRQVLFEANHASQHKFTEVEEGHYRTNHAVVGYFIAKSWHLPATLCELILRHHDPEYLTEASPTIDAKNVFALMKMASAVATQYKYGKTDTEWPTAREFVLTQMRMSDIDFQDMQADLIDDYHTEFAGY